MSKNTKKDKQSKAPENEERKCDWNIAKLMEKAGLLAPTFGDVLLQPGYSEILPKWICIEGKLTKKITLKTPLLAAAMDTVSETEMAIAMAMEGGIAVIHRYLSPEVQASMVGIVRHKIHINMIKDPVCVYENETVKNFLEKRKGKGYEFHCFPVLNEREELVGLITETEFEFTFDENPDLLIKDLKLIAPITVDHEITREEAHEIIKKERLKILIIVDENKHLKGIWTHRDVKAYIEGKYDNYSFDSDGQLLVAAAIGVGWDARARMPLLAKKGTKVVVIDSAHAHSKNVIETVIECKANYPETEVIVGNIATAEAAEALINAGADGLKVGIGPGSICTTRDVTGVGVPQLYAIYQVAKRAYEMDRNVAVIGDGGITDSGGMCKAFSFGADSVMLGGLLAATNETPGETYIHNGVKCKSYRGMGSPEAKEDNKKHNPGAQDRYDMSNEKTENESDSKPPAEGTKGDIRIKGPVKDEIFPLLMALRASMGYQGAKDIENLHKKAKFVLQSIAGQFESSPHIHTISE